MDHEQHAREVLSRAIFLRTAIDYLDRCDLPLVEEEVERALAVSSRGLAGVMGGDTAATTLIEPRWDPYVLRGFVPALGSMSGAGSHRVALRLAPVLSGEDSYRSLRSQLMERQDLEAEDLFLILDSMAAAALSSWHGREAIDIIAANQHTIRQHLDAAAPDQQTLLAGRYVHCLRDIVRVLDRMDASDFAQFLLAPLSGRPEEGEACRIVLNGIGVRNDSGDLNDYANSDRQAASLLADGEVLQRLLEDLSRTDVNAAFVEVVRDMERRVAAEADLHRINSVAARVWAVAKDASLDSKGGAVLWERARSDLEATVNSRYRLAKLGALLEQDLDANILKGLRAPENKSMLESLLKDPRLLGGDLETIFLRSRKPSSRKPAGLSILRRWASAHPLAAGVHRSRHIFGGGLFLSAFGLGIAIDPGPDYLENLAFFSPFEFADITHIFVSHRHVDHCESVKRMMSLGYERHRSSGGAVSPIPLLMGEPDDAEFDRLGAEHAAQKEHLDSATAWRKTAPGGNGTLEIRTFKVDHASDMPTCAAVFRLLDIHGNPLSIGYTADAAFDQAGAGGPESVGARMGRVDILVANISTVTFADLVLEKGSGTHLGLTGILRVLLAMPELPSIVVLNEWALQNLGTDHRLAAAEVLRHRLAVAVDNGPIPAILVGEIGTLIEFDEHQHPRVRVTTSRGSVEAIEPRAAVQSKSDHDSLIELIRTSD